MRVLLLGRYGARAASSRLRSLQFLDRLRERGIEVEPQPLFDDAYVQRVHTGRGRDWAGVLAAYLQRVRRTLRARAYDLVWIEKELLPGLPALLERGLARRGPPYLADYDDAVFHRYDTGPWLRRALLGRKIDVVMRGASVVTAGNEYLAARARRAGAGDVRVLPTVLEPERYTVREHSTGTPLTIGWMGSPRNSSYLEPLRGPLARLARERELRVLLVGSDERALQGLPVERRPWSLESEASDIAEFDVGVMPLPDEPFERGKCGYKLIQYMAAGVPVVATPLGVNESLVEGSGAGFLAGTDAEWEAALAELADDAAVRARCGAAGRAAVVARYSVDAVLPLLESALRDAARRS